MRLDRQFFRYFDRYVRLRDFFDEPIPPNLTPILRNPTPDLSTMESNRGKRRGNEAWPEKFETTSPE
jgi:hypothetical protein